MKCNTKKQDINEQLEKTIKTELRKQYLIGTAHGFEMAFVNIVDFINKGKTIEEVKQYAEKVASHGKDAMIKVHGIEIDNKQEIGD